MKGDSGTILTEYIGAFINELAQNNLQHAVVSPGSRSTPIAMLLAAHPDIEVHMNMDERSAGFYALGLAKSLQEPVALVCTSGTAAANYYPAVIEAAYSRVPLLVLTADRPHEQRDNGSPQTIDQIQLYGNYVKWFVEMALPESTEPMMRYARTIGVRALSAAKNLPAGPVHLNFPLREPLVPNMNKAAEKYKEPIEEALSLSDTGVLSVSEMQETYYANLLADAERGMIVCGELVERGAQEAIIMLGEKLGFPVLADPLSQLRSGPHRKDVVIDTYDTILRASQASAILKPDVILRFGTMPVSKPLLLFLKEQRHAQHVVVDGGGGWRDPAGLPAQMVYCDERRFCDAISQSLPDQAKNHWLSFWQNMNDKTKQALRDIREAELNEGMVFSLLGDHLPDFATLFVGNSMPIRDLDTFFHANDKNIRIFANRGANGIDGVVSTAAGMSAVSEHTVLVIGDLSFFHDMNGLLAARLEKVNMTILLINNDGGGIFSFLPQATEKEHFETLFGTPHGLDFSHTAGLYGAAYKKVKTWEEWESAFCPSFAQPGLKIIEVPTDRAANVQKHRKLWDEVIEQVSLLVNEGI
ncbi:2-succinyl-5-enolpyruvyl-6-hydroxy-3-cyclohexene-1-carboxylic-acid synthase [Bacillus piscicola]|uniref:2-succinyl-5-enolpyruvyl-6-hydroxy-3- cyclohexene-1-carboxylic-acid synthase n=1 Tax=Bacillus piscicola TaxID=1632684 RepID=UPI001F088C3E|nr:2-succinyl-5-enolpyruvyl-6-hydroxy-3-cyclohexene-1-carboxylic-acid synthase [Bacillus piscicola]